MIHGLAWGDVNSRASGRNLRMRITFKQSYSHDEGHEIYVLSVVEALQSGLSLKKTTTISLCLGLGMLQIVMLQIVFATVYKKCCLKG